MAIKLIKACKELNIGMSTAVEFAAKHGKEVATDPNTRIDDDLYLLLAKEFNKDMALKMEAERMQQERQEREIPQVLTVEPEQPKEPEKKVMPQPKVVGKIDLNPKKKAKEDVAPQPEAEELEQKEVAPQKENKAEEPEVKKAKEPEVKPEQKEVPQPEKKQKPKQEPKPEPEEKPAEVEPEAPKKAPEVFTLGKPVLKNAPKVVGKIDLDNLNQQTHPTKKTKEEKKQLREQRKQQNGGAPKPEDAANGSKRKRERIRKDKVDVNNPDFKKGGKAGKGKKPIRVEVDDEEVQRQIKETLNRMQAGKGKSSGAKYRKEKRENIRIRPFKN